MASLRLPRVCSRISFAALGELCDRHFNRKGRKVFRKGREEIPEVLPAHDGNAFGASDTTMSLPSAIRLRISMCRLRKWVRARSPQARTK